MKNILLFFLTYFLCQAATAQSDFIIVKKKDKTLKSIYVGSDVSFTTSLRLFSGRISSIKNDTVNLLEYDIRQIPSSLGVYFLDTVATYRTGIYYKDILKILNQHRGFDLAASGASLFGGGILLTTIGLGTWIFAKSGERYHASPKLVIGSALLGGAGYALLKNDHSSLAIGKKYQLIYIKTN